MAIKDFFIFSYTSNNSTNPTSMDPFYSTSRDLSSCSVGDSMEMGNSASFMYTKSYDEVLRTFLGVIWLAQSAAQRLLYHPL